MPFSRKFNSNKPKQVTQTRQKPCKILPPYRNGIVLRGYDVVEYRNLPKDAKGVKGSPDHKYVYKNGGAEYSFHFINCENLERFSSDVERFLPQFGGFCSWGFANEWGAVVEGKPIGDPDVPANCEQCLTNPPWPWTQYIMGPPADTENAWSIYKDRLYFNINSDYRSLWEANPDVFIKRARDRWTKYYQSAIGPLNVHSYPWNWKDSTTLTKEQTACLSKS